MDRLVAVTGATGFLGSRLVEALAERGWKVRSLARRPVPSSQADEVVLGDLADEAALRRLAAGAEVVVHCAGLIKAPKNHAFFEVNRDGAAAVARAAGDARLIFVSSLAAREPGLSPYAASKRAGELACSEIAGDRLTIVRPPAIYGPGDRETWALFRLADQSPVLPLLGRVGARLALAHVDDVAASIAELVERPAGTGPITPAGARAEGYEWREILATACEAVGRSPRAFQVPAWALLGAGWASDAMGGKGASVFGLGKAREILHCDWGVAPHEQARGAPAARFSLKEGFIDAVTWYRARGWLAPLRVGGRASRG